MSVLRPRWSLAAAGMAYILFAPSFAAADYCTALRADLARLDRAARSPAQQLRSLEMQAGRAGCFGGFFFFGPSPSRGRCSALMARISALQRGMWANGSNFGWDGPGLQERRASLRQALARSGCNAAPRDAVRRADAGYRTLCVRKCDGYYFPISYATQRHRFKTDAAACQSMYPAGEAELYIHRTVGEDATQAISLTGVPYTQQSFAFAYRATYDHVCAALFRPGSGAQIAINKPPVPPEVVAASLARPVFDDRRQKSLDENAAAADETPANLDPDVQAAEAAEARVNAGGMRMVGPVSYREPVYLGSTAGEPPKLATTDISRGAVASTDQPPVRASILADPLDWLLQRKSAPQLQEDIGSAN